MKTVSYKGFQASVEFEDGALFVRVLHIDDLLIAQVDAASEAQKALEDLVEAYLTNCEELGRIPHRPFSGSFNVRMDRELHRRASVAAAAAGETLNAWVSDAVQQKVECDRFSDRVNGVLLDMRAEVTLLQNAGSRRRDWRHIEIAQRTSISSRTSSPMGAIHLLPRDESESAWSGLDG